jgi:hypothetical protein
MSQVCGLRQVVCGLSLSKSVQMPCDGLKAHGATCLARWVHAHPGGR